MIVEKSFIDAINYSKKNDILIRPEYWSQWIHYDKSRACFYWCDKNGNNEKWHGVDSPVTLCDHLMSVSKWEFMCDELVDDRTGDDND